MTRPAVSKARGLGAPVEDHADLHAGTRRYSQRLCNLGDTMRGEAHEREASVTPTG